MFDKRKNISLKIFGKSGMSTKKSVIDRIDKKTDDSILCMKVINCATIVAAK